VRRAVWIAIPFVLVLAGCGSYSLGEGERVTFATVDADPDWSPDGRLVAFASSRGGGGVFVVQPNGRRLRRLFRGNASNVDWSPDGRRIAFQGDHGIYVMRADGRRATRVLRGERFSLPAWAPDGRSLAVVMEERDLSTGIYVVRPDGTALRRLLPQPVARSDPTWSITTASETEPAWSPDGRRIALQAGDGRIVSVEVATGHARLITKTRGFEPAWSPDGRLIAFQAALGVWVANADGSGRIRRLAAEGGDPSWAPDSRRVVFEVFHDQNRYTRRAQSLSVVDATGGHLRKLTFGGSVFDNPGWRGDGQPV
jgi:TolB protein